MPGSLNRAFAVAGAEGSADVTFPGFGPVSPDQPPDTLGEPGHFSCSAAISHAPAHAYISVEIARAIRCTRRRISSDGLFFVISARLGLLQLCPRLSELLQAATVVARAFRDATAGHVVPAVLAALVRFGIAGQTRLLRDRRVLALALGGIIVAFSLTG
jgi:hypothetical protein